MSIKVENKNIKVENKTIDYSKYECPFSQCEKEFEHKLELTAGAVQQLWCKCGFRGPLSYVDPKKLNLKLKKTLSQKQVKSCANCKHKDEDESNDICCDCVETIYHHNWEPIQMRPMNAQEIAQYCVDNGYMLCRDALDGVINYNTNLFDSTPSLNEFRYLKPNSKELHKFDEVEDI